VHDVSEQWTEQVSVDCDRGLAVLIEPVDLAFVVADEIVVGLPRWSLAYFDGMPQLSDMGVGEQILEIRR